MLTPGKKVERDKLGAYHPRTGRVVDLIGERKNSDGFIASIDTLRHYRRAHLLHLVLDVCIVHKSRETLPRIAQLHGRIVLDFLSPYFPNHDSIRRLRNRLYDIITRNHRHRTIDSLVADGR